MNKEQLKAKRKAQGLTMQKMAEKIGVSARAYAYYESGERAIPLPVEKLIMLQEKGVVITVQDGVVQDVQGSDNYQVIDLD